MEAGQELDALIAEKVMGLEPWPGKPGAFRAPIVLHYQTPKPCLPPSYSTEIAAAWKVVEKLDGQWSISGQEHTGWEVSLVEASMREDRYENPFVTSAPTAPHAICLAALKAMDK